MEFLGIVGKEKYKEKAERCWMGLSAFVLFKMLNNVISVGGRVSARGLRLWLLHGGQGR